MRIRLLMAIICTLLFSSLFILPATVFAAIDVTPIQGVVGTEVTASGLVAGQTYTVKWNGSSYRTGAVSATGTVTFTAPESSTGTHTVVIESPSGTLIYTGSFTVLPSISIDPATGIVGTTVTVKGTGFVASEEQIKVTFKDTTIKSGIKANSNGSWETTFAVPATPAGNQIVDSSGNNTTAATIADRTFVVKPNLVINPSFGSVGTQVTVSGTGFAASESGISFTYDGAQMKTSITADSGGSWSSSFIIPQSTKGNHTIDASGASTSGSDVPDLLFAVSPGIVAQPNSLFVNDNVSVTGSGFSSNEDNIKLFFDDINIKSGIKADVNGYWTTSFIIPESVNGDHIFDASGDATSASDTKDAIVTLNALLTLKPAQGNIGEEITISGNGFSKSKDVEIDYGGKILSVSLTTDSKGSFSATVLPLEGIGGQIKIQARDTEGVAAFSTFAMDATPPETPRIGAPKDGARVGYIGDTRVGFDWSDVADPSGVYYVLQVTNTLDFSNIIIEVPKLTQSEYKLTEAESLAPGDYFWRVKAIDKAGNSSDWVGPMIFRTAFVDVTTFAIIVAAVIAFIIIISIVPRAIARAVRKRNKKDDD